MGAADTMNAVARHATRLAGCASNARNLPGLTLGQRTIPWNLCSITSGGEGSNITY